MNTPESGHNRNVTNFAMLVSACESFGSNYRPARTNLKLESLRALRDESRSQLDACHAAKAAWSAAVVDRANAFAGFGDRITRINNAIHASDSTERLDDRIGQLVRRLRGARAKAVAPVAVGPESAADGTVVEPRRKNSVSHAAFTDKLDDLTQLIKFIAEIPGYAPNEDELTLVGLEAWKAELSAKNQAVLERQLALANVRALRDQVLYATLKGLTDTASDTKAYVRSVFGAGGVQTKQVAAITFRKVS